MKKKIQELKKKLTKKNITIVVASLCLGGAVLHLGGYNYLHSIFSSTAGGAAVEDEEGKDISKFQEANQCGRNYPWGTPVVKDDEVNKRSLYICRTGYAIQYDPKTKISLWETEVISKNNIVPFNIPSSIVPQLDPEVPTKMQASIKDYATLNNGYKLGYLAPIENMYQNTGTSIDEKENINRIALSESMYLTNAVPETMAVTILKKKIDAQSRQLVLKRGTLYGAAGPVFLNGKTNGFIGQGENKIAIPTHLFKIVTDPNTYGTLAYLIPNTNLPCGTSCDPTSFLVPLKEVERVTGIEFYSSLAPIYAAQVRQDVNEIQRKEAENQLKK